MSTEEWARSAQQGDHEAFQRLLMGEKERLYSIAYAYLHNESDALEAIQETTCRAYVKLGKLREPRYFRTWLIRILIRYCIDEQKRKRRTLPLYAASEPLAADLALEDRLRLGDRPAARPAQAYYHSEILSGHDACRDCQAAGEAGRHGQDVAEQSLEPAQGNDAEGGGRRLCQIRTISSITGCLHE